jgi:hypothetical protein
MVVDVIAPAADGIWITTQAAKREDVEKARPILKDAFDRGDTACWIDGWRWTWIDVPGVVPVGLPVVNADVLGRAIAKHRQAMFAPGTPVSESHLCFDDCADDIYARCLELIAE